MQSKVDILRDLFDSRYFSFIMNSEGELSTINKQIEQQNGKKVSIYDMFNNSEIVHDLTEKQKNDIDRVVSSIDSTIASLTSLKDYLSAILYEVSSLTVSIEAGTKDHFSSILAVQEIKDKINSYKKVSLDIKGNILISNINVSSLEYTDSDNYSAYTSTVSTYTTQHVHSSNNVLLISSKDNKVFSPYTESDVQAYLDSYPGEYESFEDVVEREFVVPLSYYSEHSNFARFRETFSLIKEREERSVFEATKIALKVMNKEDVNPAVIAACKNYRELRKYLECIENDSLEDFHWFEIKYEVVPV